MKTGEIGSDFPNCYNSVVSWLSGRRDVTGYNCILWGDFSTKFIYTIIGYLKEIFKIILKQI